MPRRRRMQTTETEIDADSFVIDFSDVKELDDEPLPIGTYFLEVSTASLDKSKDGKPYMQLKFVVVEPEEHAGRRISDRLYLNPEALWRAKKALRALGFSVDESLDLSDVATEVVGREVDVLTKIDTLPLDGRKVTRINRYIPLEEGGFEEGEDEEEGF